MWATSWKTIFHKILCVRPFHAFMLLRDYVVINKKVLSLKNIVILCVIQGGI